MTLRQNNSRRFAQILSRTIPRARLRHANELAGVSSARMTLLTYDIGEQLGRQLLVRDMPGANSDDSRRRLENEYRILQLTEALPVSAPRALTLEPQSGPYGAPYLLIEYIQGEVSFARAREEERLRLMAEHLARLHKADLSRVDHSFLRREGLHCGEPPRLEGLAIHKAFGAPAIIDHLRLSGPRQPSNPDVLLHGDYWPGNVLWQDGRIAAIIDWEDAMRGDPLIDLARSRSEIAWIFGIDLVEQFTEHYRSHHAINCDNLAYWDLCAALRQVRLIGSDLAASAAYFAPYGRSDISPQSIDRNLSAYIAQALGRLSI